MSPAFVAVARSALVWMFRLLPRMRVHAAPVLGVCACRVVPFVPVKESWTNTVWADTPAAAARSSITQSERILQIILPGSRDRRQRAGYPAVDIECTTLLPRALPWPRTLAVSMSLQKSGGCRG